MNNRLIIDQVGMLFVAACLLTGCNHSSTPVDRPTDPLEQSAGLKKVIFYVAGMNQRLKISWGDWPNKVKQALEELDGVESVEDEWERMLVSDDDLDLLFVTYRADKITVARLMEKIKVFGFEAEVKK